MKLFRKIVFWCHLATGVSVAAVVLIMSATGVLLAFERQIIEWADTRGLSDTPPTPAPERLGTEEILAAVQEPGERPVSIRWYSDADAPVAVSYGRDRIVFVNAYTGAVLGTENETVRAFFEVVIGWHRWLGLEGDGRSFGRSITGACNLGFLFLIVSGFYLWWPRNWKPAAVRNVTLFRRGLSPKARNFNWHNVIGFWSFLPLFVIIVSGVVISYPWASDLVYELASASAPADRGHGPRAVRQDVTPVHPGAQDMMDLLVGRAAARLPDWRTLVLELPASRDTTVTFVIDRGTGGQPQKRAELTLDRRTGREVRWEPFEADAPGRRLYSLLRFSHTGEVLGLFGQTLAGLVSLGTTLLIWTGLTLAWRRFRAWRKRRKGV